MKTEAELLASVTLERDQWRAKLAEYEKAGEAQPFAFTLSGDNAARDGGWIDAKIVSEGEFNTPLYTQAALTAAYARGKAEENEACAKAVEPKQKRPCDCSYCDMNCDGDKRAEVAEWDRLSEAAAAYNEWAAEAAKREKPLRAKQDGPGPSSTAYPVPTPVERRPKPEGYVSLAELDEMSMKPEDRT